MALVLPGLVLTAVCFRLEDNSHMTTRVYLQEVNTSLEYSISHFFFPRFVSFLSSSAGKRFLVGLEVLR